MGNTHETLASLFTATADAIRSKTGSTGPIVADQFPGAISDIQVGVDTSDANATAADIVSGKTAYVDGNKVTGSIEVVDALENTSATPVHKNGRIGFSQTVQSKMVMDANTAITLAAPEADFGDATPADVAAGKTFTSAAGVMVTGEAEAGSGVEYENINVAKDSTAIYFSLNRITKATGAPRDVSIGYNSLFSINNTTAYKAGGLQTKLDNTIPTYADGVLTHSASGSKFSSMVLTLVNDPTKTAFYET